MTVRLLRRFRLMMVGQVVLLALTLSGLAVTLLKTNYLAVPALVAMLVAWQVHWLLRSVQSHVSELEEFFAAINYQDFTRRFPSNELNSAELNSAELNSELGAAFNRVIERFQEARTERDLQASYLDTVVRHVPLPLLAVTRDGRLSIVNQPARRLVGLNQWTRIDQLDSVAPGLASSLAAIDAGTQQLVQVRLRGMPAEWRVSVSEIRREGEVERLYALENLSGELVAREGTAWRNLIRVLTHEMMNTLTPVTSLAQTARELLDEPDASDDVREALATIERRGNGLIQFVSRYREFMQVPEPRMAPVAIGELFDDAIRLESTALGSTRVIRVIEPEGLTIEVDRDLIDQVLVNLVKNAREAMVSSADPELKLEAGVSRGRPWITISDNGSGIPEDLIDDIFIPFFTTRKTGSGVGLALTRQIMNAHGGDVVAERLSVGTRIRLVFA